MGCRTDFQPPPRRPSATERSRLVRVRDAHTAAPILSEAHRATGWGLGLLMLLAALAIGLLVGFVVARVVG